MEPFLLNALLGGSGIALATGPLGCFVVWRKMAYFGDSLAHAALLGVALGLFLDLDPRLGILAACALFSLLLAALQAREGLAVDTLLGILAHTSLSGGLVALRFAEGVRVDLMGYLFGDVLSVATADLYWIYGGAAVALAATARLWRPLLAVTVHAELAEAEGMRPGRTRFCFLLIIALVIALAMQVVGILLVVSLLTIPAAAARRFARTPEGMAALAGAIGVLSVWTGLAASLHWDTPAGPSIVLAAAAAFAASRGLGGAIGARRLRRSPPVG